MNASFMGQRICSLLLCKWPALLWAFGVSHHAGSVSEPVCVEGPWCQASAALLLLSVYTTFSDIGLGSDSVCARPSSHRIKSFDSLGSQSSHSRTSKLLQSQYRSLVSKMFYFDSKAFWTWEAADVPWGMRVPCRWNVDHCGLLAFLGGSCCVCWHLLLTRFSQIPR